jgi:hypothetical protein
LSERVKRGGVVGIIDLFPKEGVGQSTKDFRLDRTHKSFSILSLSRRHSSIQCMLAGSPKKRWLDT